MIAVDTNVLIRLVVADHAAQAARAAAVFRSGPVFIAKSVLLEAEWVLRYSYQLGVEAILRSLRAFVRRSNASISAAGRKNIIEATNRRWATIIAAKQAA